MDVQIREPVFEEKLHRYRIGYKTADGKWRNTYARDKKKAMRRYDELKVELQTGVHIRHKIKFESAAESALESRGNLIGKKNGIRPQTYANDERHLRLYLTPYFGDRLVKQMTTGDINIFIEHMTAKEIAPKTQRHIINTLNMVCKHAVSKGYMLTNICAKEERAQIRGSMGERKGYQADEVRSILAQDMKPAFRALIMTAAFTGLAANELQGLQWKDVDIYGGTISVRRTGYRYSLQDETKTEYRQRTLPLPANVISVLREWQLQCRSVFVFPSISGRMGEQNAWRKTLARLCKQAKVTDKGLGGFRKFYHTQMENTGVPESIRKYRMGHSKKSNTAKMHYTDTDLKLAQNGSDLEAIAQKVLA